MSPWFLTATERRDGSWVVRWAGVQFDPVPTESDAVDLLATLATELGGRELLDLHLHRTNGHLRRMSATEAHPKYKTPMTRRLRLPFRPTPHGPSLTERPGVAFLPLSEPVAE